MQRIDEVVEAAVRCIDQDGNATSSPELRDAVAALTIEELGTLCTALGVWRGMSRRTTALPGEALVGNAVHSVLQRLQSASPNAAMVLDNALHMDRPGMSPVDIHERGGI